MKNTEYTSNALNALSMVISSDATLRELADMMADMELEIMYVESL